MVIPFLTGGTALMGYILGFLTGKRASEQKLEEIRSEMGLDVEPDDDGWSELWKE